MSDEYIYYDSFQDSIQYFDPVNNKGNENFIRKLQYLEFDDKIIDSNNNTNFQGNCNLKLFDSDKLDFSSKSEFISKKRMAITQNKNEFCQIKLDFDNFDNFNINIKNNGIENFRNNLNNKKSYTDYNIKNNNIKIKINSKNIKKDFINLILNCFPKIKNLKEFLNTAWGNIIINYQLNKTFQLSNELLKTTPNDYIQKILEDLNKKESKEKNELITININETEILINIIQSIINDKKIINTKINTNIFDDIFTEKKSTNLDDLDDLDISQDENISNNLIKKEENKENNLIIEINIENRKDNLFDRLKTMINDYFIYIFNTKVSKENKLPLIKYNYLSKIKGKPDNIKFLQNSFIKNFSHFGKESAQKERIQAIINNLNKAKEKNKEAIEYLEKPFIHFINEILKKEETRNKLFDDDRKMKVEELENNKCRKVIASLQENNNKEALVILDKYIKKNKNNYINIKDANEFKEAVNKIKGYENFCLDLTEKEKEKINERILILENLAENPMLYLNMVKQRKPRSKKKIEEKKHFMINKK